jgi:hypothetical protein
MSKQVINYPNIPITFEDLKETLRDLGLSKEKIAEITANFNKRADYGEPCSALYWLRELAFNYNSLKSEKENQIATFILNTILTGGTSYLIGLSVTLLTLRECKFRLGEFDQEKFKKTFGERAQIGWADKEKLHNNKSKLEFLKKIIEHPNQEELSDKLEGLLKKNHLYVDLEVGELPLDIQKELEEKKIPLKSIDKFNDVFNSKPTSNPTSFFQPQTKAEAEGSKQDKNKKDMDNEGENDDYSSGRNSPS